VEAYTNTVATGAEPIALSDCLCYGNPENPDQMGHFVAGCRGISEACRELNLPIVAGNVSFYNESASGSIPPSPMIACVGRLADYRRHLLSFFRAGLSGSTVYLLGARTGRWGGSIYEEVLRRMEADRSGAGGGGVRGADGGGVRGGVRGGDGGGDGGGDRPASALPPGSLPPGSLLPGPLPRVDYGELRAARETLLAAADRGLVAACHDISEGGLAVTLCEMCFPEDVGCTVTVPDQGRIPPEVTIFEETPGFVVAIQPARDAEREFLALCETHRLTPYLLGTTVNRPVVTIEGVLEMPIERARRRWEEGLMEKLL
jgi:phosphoribosylformylglycinamidine synthase subunit PurL